METRRLLIDKLKQEKCFWSYDPKSIKEVPDDILIEKTLVHLDLPEIKILCELFPKKKIKQVWLNRLVPQGQYYYELNRFFAWYLFGIKHPGAYVKSMETRYFNKIRKLGMDADDE